MATAFVFPGQGSQAVGMGLALANAYPQARQVFDEVDDALAEKLTTIMWEGPADALTLTAQRAARVARRIDCGTARAGGRGGPQPRA